MTAPHPGRIHHFADAAQWRLQRSTGFYAPPGWQSEGFIHCATRAQLPAVAARHWQGRDGVLLVLDAAMLGDALRYDWSASSGDWYPHVYSAIPVAAVIAAREFDPSSGDFPE